MGGRYGGNINGRGQKSTFKVSREVLEAIGKSARRIPRRAAKGLDELTAPRKAPT